MQENKKRRRGKQRETYLRIHTAGEVTEDNENSLSSGWNFLDRFKLQDKFNIWLIRNIQIHKTSLH